MSEKIVYRIINRETGEAQGVYSRACHDEYDFPSPVSARNANVHGIYEDESIYAINKYKITYELIEEDVPTR